MILLSLSQNTPPYKLFIPHPPFLGTQTINDQVQGGAPSYRHNLMLLEKFGFKPTPVMMRICFGVGDKQWTNHRCV